MTAPTKVDPLTMLALQVACMAPERVYKNAHTCYVPWSLVEDIRRELEKRGINWRAILEPVRQQRENEQARWVRARMEQRVKDGTHCPDCMASKRSRSPFAALKHYPGCKRRDIK